MPKQTKIAIPIALAGAVVTLLIWLSNLALATERRISCVEVEGRNTDKTLSEIKQDIREIKHDVKQILIERKEARLGN